MRKRWEKNYFPNDISFLNPLIKPTFILSNDVYDYKEKNPKNNDKFFMFP